MTKRAYISFDFDNDEDLRNLLVGQAKNTDSPFEISDWSAKEPWPENKWEEMCLQKLKKTDMMIIIVGEKTHLCKGVKKEILMAKKIDLPFFGIKGRKDSYCPLVEGLDKVYVWTWDNLKLLINGGR